ncbi:LETM1 domain-containing protein 1 isoform X2 [Belonocnema kinseyi]|uniref:LETM1 domain-containing protein 1 isoform X2 n=1 Tax=Belonocnema kinseyi TaxID=2817044 RepID=UPI00143D44B7|nr:LETM1 domain-containing protein 1 isoform X2 [Belonocnema kinseyi]
MYKIGNGILSRGNCLTSFNTRQVPRLIQYGTNSKNPSEKRADITQRRMAFFKKMWLLHYMNFISSYQKNLEKKFPKMKIMRIFNSGIKDLYLDIKRYVFIRKKQKQQGIEKLTRDELELSFTLPKDLIKVSPILLISAIPFTNYIVLPMIYLFPRTFLISHFWSIQQRLDYLLYEHKRKLKYNKSVLRSLQAEMQNIDQPSLKVKWSGVIASLGSGTHPTTSDIIASKQIFIGQPYSLNSLRKSHVKELLRVHGMPEWKPFRRKRLLDRGLLIKRMDTAIRNEGGVTKVPNEALKWRDVICYARLSLLSFKSFVRVAHVIFSSRGQQSRLFALVLS